MAPSATRDLSSGLSADREQVVADPPDLSHWSENLFFTMYDPAADLGLWAHLGTYPTDWTMWEDWVMVTLPGDGGMLSTRGYHRTPPERRPAGSNLAFECVEPFRRWRITFDGRCLLTPYDELQRRRVSEGVRYPLAFDLAAECVTPVWDSHTSASSASGRGSIRGQSWATDHYQQLLRLTGTVHLPDGAVTFDGVGWRDHSRGPRYGPTGARWGGHAILSGLFPSGRAFGLSRMWAPDGTVTLDAGYMVDGEGTLHHAEVLEVPRLRDIQLAGEPIPMALRSAAGEVALTGETLKSTWITRNHGIAPGLDLTGEASILAEAYARWEWDGEVGYGLCERSEHLHDIPDVRCAPQE